MKAMNEAGFVKLWRGLPTFLPYMDWELELIRYLVPSHGNLIGYDIVGGMTDNIYYDFRRQTINNQCGDCKGDKKDCKDFQWRACFAVDHENQEIKLGYFKCNQEALVKELKKAAYVAAGLPLRYWNFKSEDYNAKGNTEVLKTIANLITLNKPIYIYGKVGTGKTLAMAMLGRKFQDSKKTVQFYTVSGLLTKMKEGLTAGTLANETDDSVSQIHKRCKKVDLLILDDLGTEQPTAWSIEQIFLIINERYNDEKPTAITSNLNLDELMKRWSKFGIAAARLLSRLSEYQQAKTSDQSYR